MFASHGYSMERKRRAATGSDVTGKGKWQQYVDGSGLEQAGMIGNVVGYGSNCQRSKSTAGNEC